MESNYTLKGLMACLIITQLLTVACYRETDLSGNREQEGENLLTLNSIVNPDSAISVAALRTYFFSDKHSQRQYVEGLDMQLLINGKPCDKLKYNATNNHYESTIKPMQGDEITLLTRMDGTEVEATDVVPRLVEIENISISRQGPVMQHSNLCWLIDYQITFTDAADDTGYYYLQIDDAEGRGRTMGTPDYSHEFVFQQLARQVNATLPGWKPEGIFGLPFSDKGIEGKTHTLMIQETVDHYAVSTLYYGQERMEVPRRFKLYALSKNYYDYLLTILCNKTDGGGVHGGMIDLGVAEPIRIHSNVKGGTGILGAYTLCTRKLDLVDKLGPFE